MQGLSPVPPRQNSQVYINADRPAYRVIEKRGFFDDMDTLWEKGRMIYWDGEPNPGLEPLNEKAESAMREYLEALDAKAKQVAEKRGTGYASQVNAFDAKRRLDDMDRKSGRQIDQEEMTPIMGAKKDRKPKAEGIGAEGSELIPLMGSSHGKGKKEVNKASDISKGLV